MVRHKRAHGDEGRLKEDSRRGKSLQQTKLLKGVIDSKLGFVEYFKVHQKPTNNKPSKYQLNLHRKCQGISQLTEGRRPVKTFSRE